MNHLIIVCHSTNYHLCSYVNPVNVPMTEQQSNILKIKGKAALKSVVILYFMLIFKMRKYAFVINFITGNLISKQTNII